MSLMGEIPLPRYSPGDHVVPVPIVFLQGFGHLAELKQNY